MECVEGKPLQWRGRKRAIPSLYLRRLYERRVGPIEPGQVVHHSCGNPWCGEPSHLVALTRAEHVAAHRYRGLALGFDETAHSIPSASRK